MGEREGSKRLGGALKLINIFNVFGTLHVLHSPFSSVESRLDPALPSPAQPLAVALALGASSLYSILG